MVKSQVCGGEFQAYFYDAGAKAKQSESRRAPPVTTCAMLGPLPKLCVSHDGLVVWGQGRTM